MRPMRLHKRELKEAKDLRHVLESCDVVRIGASDEEGMFIVPVNFGYEFKEEDGKCSLKLYIHSAGEGRKADAFAEHPQVAFEMDCGHEIIRGDYTCSYSFAFQSIMGNGTIRKVESEEEKVHGLTLLMQHMEPQAEIAFTKEMLERVAVYCVESDTFTGKQRSPKQADKKSNENTNNN